MSWKHGRRLLLSAVNIAATVLTLITGFRENVIVQSVIGSSGQLRSRLRQGRINYGIARVDEVPSRVLPDLVEIADAYRFHPSPKRSPFSTGEDRSTCMRVNSMNASVLSVHFDDAFGQNVRREQLFVFSISPPHCAIMNLKPAWVQQHCVDGMFEGNTTACDEYIATNFNRLLRDRSVQVGVPVDFGEVGMPYLQCQGRPDQPFLYATDLMVMQSFWGGGSFQVEVQSSKCLARPVVVLNDNIRLFRAESVDNEATISVAVPLAHELAGTVSAIYSLYYIGFVIHGLRMVFLSKSSFVWYLTSATKKRFLGYLRFLPFTDLMGPFVPVRDRIGIFRFHGKPVVAANLWMNHWLFIFLSILDATLNVRSIYMKLTMGTWLLSRRVTFENFLFVLAPLTKITWITCLAHTIFQRVAQTVLSIVNALFYRLPPVTRLISFLRWYVDAVALLSTFKMYAVALVFQLYIVFKVKGVPTMSTRATNPKRPVFGGFPDVESLWKSEIVIDLGCIVLIQIAFAHVLVSVLLLTRLRHATHNRVLRILQRRYVFVGWDAFVSMDALGIDPFREHVRDETGQLVATTHCTAGALLRQLGSSGPSGWVRLVGEEALLPLHEHNSHTGIEPLERQIASAERFYPFSVALEMGIRPRLKDPAIADTDLASSRPSSLATSAQIWSVRPLPNQACAIPDNAADAKVPFQLRILHAHVEWNWGSVLLVDFAKKPAFLMAKKANASQGKAAAGEGGGVEERQVSIVDTDQDSVVVVHDALYLMDHEDRHPLFVGQLKLRIC